MSEPIPDDAQAVLDFWFAPAGDPEHGTFRTLWFKKSDATDQGIVQRFGSLIERGLRGELAGWAGQASSALAQVVVLDQFTRNAFRDTPRAFAGDPQALAAASAMVGTRQDEALPPAQRAFVYMPFEHAESIATQEESLRLFKRLAAAAPQAASLLDYAERHREVIARFGRFPHRNEILGRQSTVEERQFLALPGSRF